MSVQYENLKEGFGKTVGLTSKRIPLLLQFTLFQSAGLALVFVFVLGQHCGILSKVACACML